MFYVEIDGEVLKFFEINHGTIRSILGPILYAIYVSPLFDITNLLNFADDNFALTWNKNIKNTIALMSVKLQLITSWLTDTGLKVRAKLSYAYFTKKIPP